MSFYKAYDDMTVSSLDKKSVRENFDRAAETYDEYAVLQNTVLDRLLEQLPLMRLEPARILDLGSGTGSGSRALASQYPKSSIVQLDISRRMLAVSRTRDRRWFSRQAYLCADGDHLPLGEKSFDLVFSSLSMQWSESPRLMMQEARRVLSDNGLFLFATLGPETLHELRACWDQVDQGDHVNDFHDIQSLGDALVAAGFTQPVLDVDKLVMTYSGCQDLFQDLKHTGAVNAFTTRRRTLTGKTRAQGLMQAYEQYRSGDGKLPATYEIIYGHAWSGAGANQRHGQEVRIAVADISGKAR